MSALSVKGSQGFRPIPVLLAADCVAPHGVCLQIGSFGEDWGAALARGTEIDEKSCKNLASNDWFRLKRLLEVYHTEGRALSSYDRPQGKDMTYQDVPVALRNADFDFRCEKLAILS